MGIGAPTNGMKESQPLLDLEEYAVWTKDVRECEENHQVDSKIGLSDSEVEKRLKKYKTNELEKHEGQSILQLVLDQFNYTSVRILLGTADSKIVLSDSEVEKRLKKYGTNELEKHEGQSILRLVLDQFLILIVNTIVGVWQESNTEKALEALKEIQSEQATNISWNMNRASF